MSAGHNPGADTRQRLLRAALAAFGHRDYDSVGTREIVEAARVNISAISYHFGGKRGLYLATAEYLAVSLHARMQRDLAFVAAAAGAGNSAGCRKLLSSFISSFAEDLLTGTLGEHAPGFIFREQNHPTEAYDILYRRLLQPLHRGLAELVACARGLHPEAAEARMVAHALLGQAMAFRAGRTTLLRQLSRKGYTAADMRRVKRLLSALTAAALDYRLDALPPGEKA